MSFHENPVVSGRPSDHPLRWYRLAWSVWIAWTLVYVALYLRFVVVGSHYLRASAFVGVLLLQAVGIPIYISRKGFARYSEAVIQSASSAVAMVGLPAIIQTTARVSFPHPFRLASTDALHFPFIATVLLASGIVGGTVIGVLRWRVLQNESSQGSSDSPRLFWDAYLRSAVCWLASIITYCGVFAAIGGIGAHADQALLKEIVLAVAGLFFIAPFAAGPVSQSIQKPGTRIWKYSKYSMLPVAFGTLIFAGLTLPWGLFYSPLYFVWLALPCLIWAILASYSIRLSPDVPSLNTMRSSSIRSGIGLSSNVAIVGFGVFAQVGVLFSGLLAASPRQLGLHGIGCVNVYNIESAEYWFWQGYKGLASETKYGNEMVLRTSVDPSVCMVLNEKTMKAVNDPVEVSHGYVAAARAWSWLIEPAQWENPRTRQIRMQLSRLLGREFSSYEELESWWNKNGRYLKWSESERRLQVQEPTVEALANRNVYQISQQISSVSMTESESEAPWLFGPKPIGAIPDYPDFRSQDLDPEARLRGLKLYVAENIQVLTDERPRRIRKFLREVTGEDFSTKREWEQFFKRPLQNPWRVSRDGAQAWMSEIREHGDDPGYRAFYLSHLQEETQQNYSYLEDFIPWLENPDNTRAKEWVTAFQLVPDTYDEDDLSSPLSHKRFAIATLSYVTDQAFAEPEQWVQWWNQNRSALLLSDDGLKLVNRSRRF